MNGRRSAHEAHLLWSLDGIHLGRQHRQPVEGQVLKDAGSLRYAGLAVGPPATAGEVIRLLEQARRERGSLPLVLSTDNGAAYVSHELEWYLAERHVVHLRTVPRTPQHSAWAERGMRELKQESGLGKGVVTDMATPRVVLTRASSRLDNARLRRSRWYRTAAQCDREMPCWYHASLHARLFTTACRAIQDAVRSARNARASRALEREAIFATMDDFGLITRTRGGEPMPARKPEDVS